jgi:hypothetical protein
MRRWWEVWFLGRLMNAWLSRLSFMLWRLVQFMLGSITRLEKQWDGPRSHWQPFAWVVGMEHLLRVSLCLCLRTRLVAVVWVPFTHESTLPQRWLLCDG